MYIYMCVCVLYTHNIHVYIIVRDYIESKNRLSESGLKWVTIGVVSKGVWFYNISQTWIKTPKCWLIVSQAMYAVWKSHIGMHSEIMKNGKEVTIIVLREKSSEIYVRCSLVTVKFVSFYNQSNKKQKDLLNEKYQKHNVSYNCETDCLERAILLNI